VHEQHRDLAAVVSAEKVRRRDGLEQKVERAPQTALGDLVVEARVAEAGDLADRGDLGERDLERWLTCAPAASQCRGLIDARATLGGNAQRHVGAPLTRLAGEDLVFSIRRRLARLMLEVAVQSWNATTP